MTGINLEVSEEKYIELSSAVDKINESLMKDGGAPINIGQFVTSILMSQDWNDIKIVDEMKEELEALKTQIKTISARNVELQNTIDEMVEEKEPE